MTIEPSHNLIWDRAGECMPVEERREVQLKRLQYLVQRVYVQSPFYRRHFMEHGVKPDDIKSLEDLRKIPFTVKNDLRDNYPFELFASP